MRNRAFLVSALAGLFLAVCAAPALAGAGGESEKEAKSFSFFGMTFCLPSAEQSERCDVRLDEQNDRAAPALTDTAPARSESSERVVNFFGYRICLGDVAQGTECDLRMPGLLPDPDGRDRHAQL